MEAVCEILYWGEAPNKCSTFSECEWFTVSVISITTWGTSNFSSDLERAPGARSIAEEKSDVPHVVIEI